MSYKDAHAIHKIRRADYDALRASIPEEWERAISQGRESLWLEGDVLSSANGNSVARPQAADPPAPRHRRGAGVLCVLRKIKLNSSNSSS